MSDRLNLNDTPEAWADVNLSDHESIEAAVTRFEKLPGPYKVFGPADRVKDVKKRWEVLSWIPSDQVSFRLNDATRVA